MVSKLAWRVALGAMLLSPVAVEAQQLRVESGPVKLAITGRMQFQFNTTSVELEEETSPAASTFETRRVRLGVSLTIDDWITGMVEPDFALGRLQLRQAWMELGFHRAFGVRAGQWKKPFSLIELTSSTQIPMIERAVRIRGLDAALEAGATAPLPSYDGDVLLGEEQALLEALGYHSYDLGAAVRGRVGGLGYEVGMFNGTGSDSRDDNDGKSLAGRATYALPLAWPVTLGVGVSRRDHVVETGGVGVTEHGNAWEADLELGGYRRAGPWVLAEYAQGDNLGGGDFRGAQAVATWFIPTGSGRIEGVEPVFRWSFGDPDTRRDGDGGMLYTPGVNFHFFGRNKLMLNWDVYVPESDLLSSESAARAQVQLHF